MTNLNQIFEAVVYLKNGDHMNLCFSTFDQMCYNLNGLDKSAIDTIQIRSIKVSDMRQGRHT